MPSVKGKRSKLERALDRADDYVAEELVDTLKELVSIGANGTKEDGTRVAALRAILGWAKPNRSSTVVNVNSNNRVQIKSRLGLPNAPPSKQQARVIDMIAAPKPVQKILPEAPRSIGEGLRPFTNRETFNDMSEPEPLPARTVEPRAPDKPAAAKSIKPYD